MRNRWQKAARAIMAGGLLLGPGLLLGQEPAAPAGDQPATPPGQEFGVPVQSLEMPGSQPGSLTSAQGSGASKVIYVVHTGDTLWDIAARYMNSPYYWPKVWERNPFVINPHWIYPGDQLNLYPSSEKLSAPAEMSTVKLEQAPAETMKSETIVETAPEQAKVIYKGVWSMGYLDVGETQAAGSIMSNPDDKALLGSGDLVYVNVGSSLGVKESDLFTIFRVVGDIKHPRPPYHVVGNRIINLGELKISQVKENVADARIINSYQEIQDGDRIAPFTPPLSQEILYTPNQISLDGYIIGNKNDTYSMGRDEIIYIDKGAQDGVLRGNIFEVYLPGETKLDAATGQSVSLPDQVIGQLMVVDPRPSTSVTLCIQSVREFTPGDHIRMLKP
jgi:hypothetical protein